MEIINEEKCTYCREYGNLPCDECNRKLEANKAMSRLDEIMNEIVQEYGYKSFEKFDDKSTFNYNHDTPKIIKNIALRYAKEVAIASLEIASENACNNLELYKSEYKQLTESITNPDNILML